MKKRNTFLGVALLLAVVVLGVGYAAATGPWVINGTAKASASTEFDVDFTAAVPSGDGVTAAVTNDLTATMEVTLSKLSDTGSATFTLTNNSPAGIGATFTENMITIYKEDGTTVWENGSATTASSQYFDITTSAAGTGTIKSVDGTATVTVTVTLKKVAVNEVAEKFVIKIDGITATQE